MSLSINISVTDNVPRDVVLEHPSSVSSQKVFEKRFFQKVFEILELHILP